MEPLYSIDNSLVDYEYNFDNMLIAIIGLVVFSLVLGLLLLFTKNPLIQVICSFTVALPLICAVIMPVEQMRMISSENTIIVHTEYNKENSELKQSLSNYLDSNNIDSTVFLDEHCMNYNAIKDSILCGGVNKKITVKNLNNNTVKVIGKLERQDNNDLTVHAEIKR